MSANAAPTVGSGTDMTVPANARVRELITPEGVDLRLTLPEAGERAAAFFLDLAFMAAMLIAASLLIIFFSLSTSSSPRELLASLWLLVFFFLRNFYFVAFELTPRAATPGKRALGIRVAMRNGGPLTAEAIFARNAVRELELFLPLSFLASAGAGVDAWIDLLGIVWCGVFVFFPFFSRDRLRVGDLIGGTWVVRAPKRMLDADLAEDGGIAIVFSAAALDAYGIKELNVLEDVLRRKDPAVVKAVAERIRAKIGVEASEPDLEFLQAYYKALRAHLESRLLFGRRRRDKFDKS
jgi:uncharacterized RDD family membrane protein YckC